jgi:glycosyltransferase involved in cell wall biosynthesis
MLLTSMTAPVISVLIDTFNHERFIEEAVQSVLAQDFPASEREILVVDDGSTDRTPELLRKFGPHIRVLHKTNGGQASAFNHGIPHCRGEIVAFLDGDDWWAPSKLSRVVQAMFAEPELGIVGHGILTVRLEGPAIPESLLHGFRFQANTLEGAHLLRTRGAFLATSRMTIRAHLLRQIGGVPEAIRVQADEYLFTLATVMAGARILPDPLTFYRLHDANLFQISSHDPVRLTAKQKSLQALAHSLSQKLDELGVPKAVRRAIVALPQASADQLRLGLEGGWPWETVHTERTLYRVSHPDAPLTHRLFRMLSLLGALVLPPRTFYAARRAVTESNLYQRVRRFLPAPKMRHIQRNTTP